MSKDVLKEIIKKKVKKINLLKKSISLNTLNEKEKVDFKSYKIFTETINKSEYINLN